MQSRIARSIYSSFSGGSGPDKAAIGRVSSSLRSFSSSGPPTPPPQSHAREGSGREGRGGGHTKRESIDKIIVDEVDYYFSPANLAGDEYILRKLQEGRGWVPIELIASFDK